MITTGAIACKRESTTGTQRPPSSSNEPTADASPSNATAKPPSLSGPERTKVTAETGAMGTRISFTALTSPRADEASVHAAIDRAVQRIRELESLMTTWQDDSEVSRINRLAGKAPVVVSRETLQVIDKSVWISGRSGGVFDITFEVMHGLWKFDQDLEKRVPDRTAIAARRKLIDYRHIILDREKSTVFLDVETSKISLGGIAKGYAIDQAAEILLAAGVEDFLAQAGGDLYMHGRRADGTPWMAGVRDPRGPEGSFFARMPIVDHAFSTAGDYERSYIIDGKRYHHIIDPRTGWPATASRSVTIWAKDALTADALDDAVFILGVEKGLELVESIDDAGAVIVDADNHVHVSKRLEGKVSLERTPTAGI
ncbi:MAG: FAD:protein FMN transferase [Polyangiaceae bacterium]